MKLDSLTLATVGQTLPLWGLVLLVYGILIVAFLLLTRPRDHIYENIPYQATPATSYVVPDVYRYTTLTKFNQYRIRGGVTITTE